MTLEKPIYHLLEKEPFFAHFILQCRWIFDHPQVPTAGVAIQNGDILLCINTEFFFGLKLTEQVAVLKHEIMHLLLEHCGPRGQVAKNKKAANIAMDCAINQHITGLPDGAITLKSMEQLVNKQLLPFETWEYYYESMKEILDKVEEMVKNHELMNQGDDTGGGSEQRKLAVKEAAGKALGAAAGKVPEGLASILGALNKAAKIPWKQQLRNFVSSARSAKNKSTRQRPNRRFELEHPGRKKIRELVLAVCIDESGSMSDPSVAECFNEIMTMAKSTKVTYVIHADCVVSKVDTIKDGKVKGDVLKTRHASGGTMYQPAIDKAMELKADAIIYMGDFDCADIPKNPGVPFIWVGIGNQAAPGNFGRVLRL